MATHELSTVLEGGSFFEGPRWHEGRWWVSDFYRGTVSRLDGRGGEEIVVQLDGQPSGTGWLPDGALLVVSMLDHRLLRVGADGRVTEHADLSAWCGGHLNDMVVDEHGGAYVGNFGFDLMGGADPATAALMRVEPDGTASLAAEDLLFPNGSAITPDGRTLIVGETIGARYTAFTVGADGSLSDRRVWAQIGPTPDLGATQAMIGSLTFAPDGCALDAEGHIWAADAVGARAARIAPGGAIVDEVAAPEGLGIFACMLGGEDGLELLLCCAPDFYAHRRRGKREGVLLSTRVEVPGAGRP